MYALLTGHCVPMKATTNAFLSLQSSSAHSLPSVVLSLKLAIALAGAWANAWAGSNKMTQAIGSRRRRMDISSRRAAGNKRIPIIPMNDETSFIVQNTCKVWRQRHGDFFFFAPPGGRTPGALG